MEFIRERTGSIHGDGAFHRRVTSAAAYGQASVAPADGVIEELATRQWLRQYITINHGTVQHAFGHMSDSRLRWDTRATRDVIGLRLA